MTSCPSGALGEAPEGWGLLSKTVLPIHNSGIEGVLDGGPFKHQQLSQASVQNCNRLLPCA